MNVVVFILLLLWASLAAAEDDALTFHPAHWVDGEDIEPTFYVSPFRALAFPSPTEGWMVGERYVLHVQGDRLEVAFVELWESLNSLSFSSPAVGWASSSHQESGPIRGYRSGVWRRDPLPGIGWPHWSVGRVMAGASGEAWAFASFSESVPSDLAFPKTSRAILHHDGSRWSVDEKLLAGRADTRLMDACQRPDGSWWFVGATRSPASAMVRALMRWDGTTLQTVVGPPDQSERSYLSEVRCLPDGTAWAVGGLRSTTGQPAEILVLRFTTSWERVPVPAFFPREATAGALAPVSAGEVWLAASCDGGLRPECCARFLHYRDGTWETVGVPPMPGGRCTKVTVGDMQFVSPDEGWAVGTDLEPRLGGGRIFHYKNGSWRLRNWNWHFWDAPWFNLFG